MEFMKKKNKIGVLVILWCSLLLAVAGFTGLASPEKAEAVTYYQNESSAYTITKTLNHGSTCVSSYYMGLFGYVSYTPGDDYITVTMAPTGRAGNHDSKINHSTHYCSMCGGWNALFVYQPPDRSSSTKTASHSSKANESVATAHTAILNYANNKLICGIMTQAGYHNYRDSYDNSRRFLKGDTRAIDAGNANGYTTYTVSINKDSVGTYPTIAYVGVRYGTSSGLTVKNLSSPSSISTQNFSGMRIGAKATVSNSNSYVSAVSGSIYNVSSDKSSGYMAYNSGSATFTIKPNANYRITGVTGGTVYDNGAYATVTVSNLTANKSISVTTTALPYITSSTSTTPSGTGGTITASGYVSAYNGSKAFTATASTNYVLDKIAVDGSTVWTAPNHTTTSYTYTVSNVTANKSIVAYFKKKPAVVATAGANGQITSPGSKIYEFYATPTYYITPGAGYRIYDVIVDGQHMGPISAYTFPYLATATDHTIKVEFAKYDMGKLATGNLTPNYVENIPLGGITVQKVLNDSPNGNPESVKDLSGIEIGLFNDRACTDPAAEPQFTDNYGKCSFKDLLTGTYYAKELSVPERLQNSMSINSEPMQVSPGSKYVYKLANNVTSMKLSIMKRVAEESAGNVDKSLLSEKNKMLRGTRFAIYPSEEDAAADTNRMRATDANGNVTDSFATESPIAQPDGTTAYETTVTGLEIGEYWVREISVNDDGSESWTVDPTPVKATETDGATFALSAMKDNVLHTGRIEVSKTVSQDSLDSMLDAQRDDVSDICEGVVYGVFTSASDASAGTSPVYSLTISQGSASIENVPYGRYYIKELSAPQESLEQGLAIDNSVVAVDVTKDGMVIAETKEEAEKVEFTDDIYLGSISIKKTDSDTNEEIEGIVFDVYEKDENGNLSEEPICQLGPTDASGSASTGQVLLLGREYEVVERIDSMPFDYTGAGEYPQDEVVLWRGTASLVASDADTMYAELSATNEKLDLRGSIDLVKKSNVGASPAGAVFKVLDESGQSIGEMVTDETGYARMDDVPIGKYSVVESEPLPNHSVTSPDTITQNTFAGEVHYDQTWHVSTPSDPIINYQGYIKVKKSSSDSGLLSQAPEKYSLAGAEYALYPIVDGEVASEALDTRIITMDNGESEPVAVPLGTYRVVEVKEPENYSTSQEMREFDITVGERNSTAEAALTAESTDTPVYIGLNFDISKKSNETESAGLGGVAQSTTNLGGCRFAVKWSPIIYEDKAMADTMEAERTWILETDEDGYASFANDNLVPDQSSELFTDKDGNIVIPTGTVTIQEVHPPDGYELGEAPVQSFVFDGTVDGYKLLTDNGIQVMDESASDETGDEAEEVEESEEIFDSAPKVEFANNIRRADIAFDKVFPADDTRSMANMGFVLTLLGDDGNPLESHLLITDENGHFSTAGGTYETANANDQWLPGEYSVNTGSSEEDFDDTEEPIDPNDVEGSDGTDESEDGTVDEGIDESGETDEGETDVVDEEEEDPSEGDFDQEEPSEDENLEEYEFPMMPDEAHCIDSRVWFSGGSMKIDEDSAKGSLVYGTYELIELPRNDTMSWQMIDPVTIVVGHDESGDYVEMNGQRIDAIPSEAVDVTDNLNKNLFDLGKIENSHIAITGTEALDSENNTHSISLSDAPVVVDTVWYENATPGEAYTFNAYVYDVTNGTENAQLLKATGFDADTGDPVEMESTYTTTIIAEQSVGNAEIKIYLEPYDIAGKTLAVKVEALHNDALASIHNEDLSDPKEMTYSPTVATSARDKATGANIGLSSSNIDIIDTVTYTNLVPGIEYTLRGTIMNKTTKLALIDADNVPVTAEISFTPTERNGTVDVPFSFTVAPNTELDLVCFEELLVSGYKIAEHKDIDDAFQNVIYPSVSTTALDANTSEHTGNAENTETVTVIDKVEYKGLAPNQEYELIGEIYVEDEQGIKHKDDSLTRHAAFTTEQSDGYVEMLFEIPSAQVIGKEITVSEKIFSNGNIVAIHDDASSAEQSVSYPTISTQAFDVESQWNIGRIREKVQLSDGVSATSLTIGQTYTIRGKLIDKQTGTEVLGEDGSHIESEETFTAEQRNEIHHLMFQLPDNCQSKQIVVYEKLYTSDGNEVASHEDIGDFAQSVSYPVISTKASDDTTSEHVGVNNEDKKVIDIVTYDNLVKDVSYTVVGTLVDPSTGLPIEAQDAPGNTRIFTAQTDFTAPAEHGDVTVEIPFDGYDMENKTTVVFERVYIHDERINNGEMTLVGEHVDAMDENQSVHYPHISTHATDRALLSSVGTSTIEGGIIDTVRYENLVPGHEYVITGKLMDANTGEELSVAPVQDEQQPESLNGTDEATQSPENGESQQPRPQEGLDGTEQDETSQPSDGDSHQALIPITASTTFTPTDFSGEIDVVFNNLSGDVLDNKKIVVFETLSLREFDITCHTDLEDAEQTVYYPNIRTSARDAKTTLHEGLVEDIVTIIDTVTYENLLPRQEYTMYGYIMDKETGEPIVNADGSQITAALVFVPEQESGSVELSFDIAGDIASGKHLVAFERLLDVAGNVLAVHEDIEDEEQTVSYPAVQTTASAEFTSNAQASFNEKMIVDEVRYQGLTANKTYTLHAVLMDKETGDMVRDIDDEIVQSVVDFIPSESNGATMISLDIEKVDISGKTFVVFEELFDGESENHPLIAQHKDIEDEGQTVYVPAIATTAANNEGDKEFYCKEGTSIIDTVEYHNLIPGKTYKMSGTLMDKATGETVDVYGLDTASELTFTPEKADGYVSIEFKFDNENTRGLDIVVFEELYLVPDNEQESDEVLVAEHKDIEDERQTVHVIGLTDIASEEVPLDEGEFGVLDELILETGDTILYKIFLIVGLLLIFLGIRRNLVSRR